MEVDGMRKYRGRKDKRAHDNMKKHKVKGSVIYCEKYAYQCRWFDRDKNEWHIAWVAYNC